MAIRLNRGHAEAMQHKAHKEQDTKLRDSDFGNSNTQCAANLKKIGDSNGENDKVSKDERSREAKQPNACKEDAC
jgi:hypothetical protein